MVKVSPLGEENGSTILIVTVAPGHHYKIFFGLYVCTHPCISWLACSCISYIHSHIGLVLLLFHPFVICDKKWDIFRQLLSFILLRGSCILLGGGAYTRWRRCLDTCLSFVYIYLYGALDYLLVSMFSMSHLHCICICLNLHLIHSWLLKCLHIWMIITYCFDHCSHILYGCWLFGQVIFTHIFSYILDCIVLVSSFLLLYLL